MYSGRGFPGILLGIFLRRFTCPVSGQLEKNAFRASLRLVPIVGMQLGAGGGHVSSAPALQRKGQVANRLQRNVANSGRALEPSSL
jgi:hypothetical protein